MAHGCNRVSRRAFLRTAAGGAASGWAVLNAAGAAEPAAPVGKACQVALTHGDSRADNVYKALKLIEPRVVEGLAKKKRVVIKPNMVIVDGQLAATHADCLEALLEFLAPHVKDEIVIAETPANGPFAEGCSNYGYNRLQDKYRVRLVDLDAQPATTQYVVNERYHPVPIRFSQVLLDPDAYYISPVVMKCHDRVVATLSLKNITVGGILKDPGYRWGKDSKGVTDKHLVHGGGDNQGIHYNLFTLARLVHPDLTVLDGFLGMERNGPNYGDPVDHKVAVASTDWLAGERVGIELMGFDFNKVGYLTFCAREGMGQADLSQIEVLGERVADHVRAYRPHDNIEQQYKWM